MPNPQHHLEQINRNKELLAYDALKPPSAKHLEWTVIILFYTALHVVEWCLAEAKLGHSKNHNDRAKLMSRVSKLKHVIGRYDCLKGEASKARYNCARFSKGDVEKYFGYLKEIEAEAGIQFVA